MLGDTTEERLGSSLRLIEENLALMGEVVMILSLVVSSPGT